MRIGIFFLACLLCLPVVAAERDWRLDRPHPVVDPAYGQILYDYYQGQQFAALSHILLALETGALPTQSERAQVLLGALYASYGMPGEAEKLFDQLLARAVDDELATRVWIHLGQLYYQQQRYTQALSILDTRVVEVPADLRQPYHALRTRILMKLGRYDETESALSGLGDGSVLGGYLRYNLAVSRINAGQGEAGEALLWQLANLPPGDEESNSLKDKAMLALGVHYLRSGVPVRANEVLGAARLEGPYSETALLLHARAWLALQEPAKALPSLQELSKRSMQFEEAQEASIALPYLYEQLGDDATARKLYRQAIRNYTEHFSYLGELEARVRRGDWFLDLVQMPAWSTAMDPLPPFQPRRVDSFATFRQLFASHDFHTRWRDYHEQWRQVRLLEQWQQRLPAMHELLAAHIRKHRDQVPRAEALLADVDAKDYPDTLRQLEDRLERAVSENDFRVLATDEQKRLIAQLDEALLVAERWPEKFAEQKEKLEFYRRVIQWEVESQRVPLIWKREKTLAELSAELDEMASLVERIRQASSGDMNRITQLGYQLAETHNDLVALESRGRSILTRQQQALEAQALAVIDYTRARLKAFTAECWIALGDLENRALRQRYRSGVPGGARSSE